MTFHACLKVPLSREYSNKSAPKCSISHIFGEDVFGVSGFSEQTSIVQKYNYDVEILQNQKSSESPDIVIADRSLIPPWYRDRSLAPSDGITTLTKYRTRLAVVDSKTLHKESPGFVTHSLAAF